MASEAWCGEIAGERLATILKTILKVIDRQNSLYIFPRYRNGWFYTFFSKVYNYFCSFKWTLIGNTKNAISEKTRYSKSVPIKTGLIFFIKTTIDKVILLERKWTKKPPKKLILVWETFDKGKYCHQKSQQVKLNKIFLNSKLYYKIRLISSIKLYW